MPDAPDTFNAVEHWRRRAELAEGLVASIVAEREACRERYAIAHRNIGLRITLEAARVDALLRLKRHCHIHGGGDDCCHCPEIGAAITGVSRG